MERQLEWLLLQGIIQSYQVHPREVEIIILEKGSRKALYLTYQDFYRWASIREENYQTG